MTASLDRAVEALLPCPWCGSAPLVLNYYWAGTHGVACNNDACPATMEMTAPTEAEAAARWNTRAPSTDSAALPHLGVDREALRGLAEKWRHRSAVFYAGEGKDAASACVTDLLHLIETNQGAT